MKIKNLIETSSNVVIIAAGILMMYTVIAKVHLLKPAPVVPQRQAIKTGDHISEFPELKWADAKQTLIVALAPGCEFCSRSMPFYSRLLTAAANGENDVRLVAAFSSKANRTEFESYLDSHKITFHSLVQLPFDTLHVSGTPTLILVDQRGMVKNARAGALPPEKEPEVFAALGNSQ